MLKQKKKYMNKHLKEYMNKGELLVDKDKMRKKICKG